MITADAIFPYLVMSVIAGLVAAIFLLDTKICPEDAALALAVLCGVFWPLAIVALIGLGLWRATCAIAVSFAALWRAVCPPRSSIPRAKVRRRSP